MSTPPEAMEVDVETLALVYAESKEAYRQLMDDLDAVSQRAERSGQLSLVMLSITIAVLGTTSIGDLSDLVKVLLLIGVGFLADSTIYVLVRNALARQIYSGTIFPDVLYNRMAEKADRLKVELVKTIAESYFYNHEQLLKQGRVVTLAQSLQIVGVFLLMAAAIVVIF